jgi:two-component system OmpR family response regulator
MSGPQILVADGDAARREALAGYLRRGDFAVSEAADAAGLHWTLGQEGADLVLLDLMLPGEGALALCRRLADARGPAVIMLSEGGEAFGQGGEADRIAALELGADDYLERPFSPRELTARIRAVLRGRAGRRSAALAPATEVYLLDALAFEPTERRLKRQDGSDIGLSESEAALISSLLARPDAFIPRETLARALGGAGVPGQGDRRIDSLVARLRRKLADHGAGDLIRTRRGEGYGLNCRVSRW